MYQIGLGTITIGTVYGIINLILIPFLSSRFSSTAIPGYLMSIGTLIAALIGPFLGDLSDRMKNRSFFVGLLSFLLMMSGIGLALSSHLLLGISAIVFVACGFSLLTPYSALVADYSLPHEKDKNFGFIMGMTNIFFFISSILIGVLYRYGEMFTLLILSIALVIPIVFLILYTRSNPPLYIYDDSITKDTLTFLKENKIIFLYFLIQFGTWFSIGGLMPYLTSFLKNEALIPLSLGASLVGAFTLFSSISSFLTGWLSKRVGQLKLYLFSLFSIFLIFALIYLLYYNFLLFFRTLMGSITILFLIAMPLGLFYSLNTSVLSTLVSPEDQGKAFGLSNFFLIISQSISISVIGKIIDTLGYRFMYLVLALGFFIGVLGVGGLILSRKGINYSVAE